MAIAFFDLDKTLLSVNSGTLVFKQLRKDRMIGPFDMARVLAGVLLYELGLIGAESMVRGGSSLTKGQREADVMAWYDALWNAEVKSTVRRAAREAVTTHRARGDATVMITSSTPYIARLAATELGMDEALAPKILLDEAGMLTGTCEEPICTGIGKIFHAEREAQKRGTTLKDCTFYSDSYSDVPLLAAVGHPVVVTPDPRLRRLAQSRGWPIEVW